MIPARRAPTQWVNVIGYYLNFGMLQGAATVSQFD